MELNYKEYGSGEPVIILHGLFGTLDNWQTFARQLSGEYSVFALDQRNHGRSPHTEEHNYHLMAEDLKQFMEEHWMFNAAVIGHSMGGKTAMQFALDYPGMVKKLVVVDIAPKAYSRSHDAIFEALLAMEPSQLKSREEAEWELAHFDADIRHFLMKNLTRRKEGGFEFKMNLPALYQHYEDVLAAVKSDHPFEGPALFVRGGRSRHVLPEDEAIIRELFPHAVVETIEKAGHWVHAETPAELLALVKKFLAE